MKALLFALILCSFLIGCGCNTNRPSLKNNYYTDYVVSNSYVLKQPIFISTVNRCLFKVGDSGGGVSPMTVEEFQKNPEAWDADLLPKGSELKISQIKYTSSFDAGSSISVTAVIINGRLAGRVCFLDFISKMVPKDDPYINVPMVDTNILEMVSKP